MAGLMRYDTLAGEVLAGAARLGMVRWLAVDGPAGAGKTTFAGRLADALTRRGVNVAVVHTDDLLCGWSDMLTFWPRLDAWVLDPLRRGEPARYRTYDWHEERFIDYWESIGIPEVLLLEGVTSARAEAAPQLTLSVFVLADRERRLARGIDRDGEALRSHWLAWMADEEVHFRRDGTAGRADILVDGAPSCAHDPDNEFVVLAAHRHSSPVESRI